MILQGFEHVLWELKAPGSPKRWRRHRWHAGTYVFLQHEGIGMTSYLAIYDDKTQRRAPWTPSRCDLLENDWERFE